MNKTLVARFSRPGAGSLDNHPSKVISSKTLETHLGKVIKERRRHGTYIEEKRIDFAILYYYEVNDSLDAITIKCSLAYLTRHILETAILCKMQPWDKNQGYNNSWILYVAWIYLSLKQVGIVSLKLLNLSFFFCQKDYNISKLLKK